MIIVNGRTLEVIDVGISDGAVITLTDDKGQPIAIHLESDKLKEFTDVLLKSLGQPIRCIPIGFWQFLERVMAIKGTRVTVSAGEKRHVKAALDVAEKYGWSE